MARRAGVGMIHPRGRPPVTRGEETYRVTVCLSASQCDRLATWAIAQGLTRKVRGEDAVGPDLAAAARALIVKGLE